VLTWITNVAVAAVTCLAARDLLGGSDLAAMIASALVMGTFGVRIGGSGFLFLTMLVPGGLVFPLLLGSVWSALRGKPVTSAFLASLAAIIHPLLGLETGAVALAAVGVSTVLEARHGRTDLGRLLRGRFLHLLLAAALLGLTVLVFWAGRQSSSLSDAEFIDLIARFRHPHHYLPSSWTVGTYLRLGCCLFAFGVSWKWWRDDAGPDRAVANRVLIVVVAIVLLWVACFFFVEVFPSRLWTTAQTFRMAFILNWLVFLLMARTVAVLLQGSIGSGGLSGAWIILLGSGEAQPLTAFLGHLVELLRRRFSSALPRAVQNAGLGLGILVAALLAMRFGDSRQSIAVIAFVAILLWFALMGPRWYRPFVPLFLVVALLCAVGLGRSRQVRLLGRLYDWFGPEITLSDVSGPETEVVRYVREHTPEDAVFLTPPNFGRFRLTARRAIVVDFKAFLFQDKGMAQWRARLEDCYGQVSKSGFDVVGEMDDSYRRITTESILLVAGKYQVSYAVLYSGTPCDFPVLFRNSVYKVVRITPGHDGGS